MRLPLSATMARFDALVADSETNASNADPFSLGALFFQSSEALR
jgi:hypothetical protein